MRAFATTLKPDARLVRNCARGILDLVVSADRQLSLALFRLDIPTRDASLEACRSCSPVISGDGGRKHVPSVPEHLDMSSSLIPCCCDNEIDLKAEVIFLFGAAIGAGGVNLAHAKLEGTVVASLEGDNLSSTKNAMSPLALVGAQLSPLVVHTLEQLLNEFESHYAVVCGTGLGQKIAAIPSRLWVKLVDVFWVENLVDTGIFSLECCLVVTFETYKGESSLGRRNSGRMTRYVCELGYKV